MTTFLHVCCADCLLRFLVSTGYPLPVPLHPYVRDYADLPRQLDPPPQYELIFYNPNIYPRSEYQARLQAVKQLADLLQLPLHVPDYRPQEYFSLPAAQAQFQATTDLSARCHACQTLRLTTILELAQQLMPGPSNFTTTMLASRYLDHQQIMAIGKSLETPAHPFVVPDFLTNPDDLRTSGYYKQNYCGCFFSLATRTRAKFAGNSPASVV